MSKRLLQANKSNETPNRYIAINKFDFIVFIVIFLSLILHAERTPFAGLDVNSKEWHNKILKAIVFFGNYFFDTISGLDEAVLDIAKRMKVKGFEYEIIEECTKIPLNILRKI